MSWLSISCDCVVLSSGADETAAWNVYESVDLCLGADLAVVNPVS